MLTVFLNCFHTFFESIPRFLKTLNTNSSSYSHSSASLITSHFNVAIHCSPNQELTCGPYIAKALIPNCTTALEMEVLTFEWQCVLSEQKEICHRLSVQNKKGLCVVFWRKWGWKDWKQSSDSLQWKQKYLVRPPEKGHGSLIHTAYSIPLHHTIPTEIYTRYYTLTHYILLHHTYTDTCTPYPHWSMSTTPYCYTVSKQQTKDYKMECMTTTLQCIV